MRSLGTAVHVLRLPSTRALVLHLVLIPAGIAFTVVSALILREDAPPAIEPASLGTTLGLLVPMMLILFGRYRWPLTVLAISTTLLVIVRELNVPEFQVSSFSWMIALYSAGR